MLDFDKAGIFFISSPFQAICAIEATSHYKIKTPYFVVLYGQNKNTNKTIDKIIDYFGYGKNIYSFTYNSFYDFLKNVSKNISNMGLSGKFFDYVFICDLFDPTQRISSYFFLKDNKTKFIYVDDGNSTLEYFILGKNNRQFDSLNLFIKTSVAKLFYKYYGKTPYEFFTIFSTNNQLIKTSQNPLSQLKNKITNNNLSGILILGSNLSNIGLLTQSMYLDYIKRFLYDIKQKFPNANIFYYAHRGESSILLEKIRKEYKLNVIISKYTIEMDMITDCIYPSASYSLCSTASYTLKILYPDMISNIIIPQVSNKQLIRSYNAIANEYSQYNINILNIVH